jgi:hypothetical protein
MTAKPEKIPASDEAWESGQLGTDYKYAEPYREDIEGQINEALELQSISIRLQKSLIEDFKRIAKLRRIGYQPLMRQVLNRFVECELKQLLKERVSEMEANVRKAEAEEHEDTIPPQKRKVA